MKKIRIFIVVLAVCIAASACHFGRHSTIVETGDHHYLKIEYAGAIHFSADSSRISSISRGGYLKYENDGRKLEARNNSNGGIRYKLFENGEEISDNNTAREFIAGAVRVMLQKNHRPNWQ